MQSIATTDVALLADVSPSTVSLYLRRPEAVSSAASRAIAHAIDKLSYVPNFMAGGLAAASSKAVSIIVPSVRNAFFCRNRFCHAICAAQGAATSYPWPYGI
ncbi:LacI family DNA-binding transcriptional regulator [Rhizobium sp.]|uniref:LacI family DNA-binding transcriptional regulator n=1 Tax=Rhizobium sp. TaxID=391 RepID=UPI002AA781E6